jgi:hypothetical protein
MPRQSTIKKNKNIQPTQADTFRYSKELEVHARPVEYDTRVRPKARNNDYQVLADGIMNFTQGIANLGVVYGDEQAKKGTAAAMKGEPIPEDAHGRYIEAHETFTGMASVRELNLIMQKTYDQLITDDADPMTFNAQMQQAVAQHFNGRSDAFVKGVIQGGGDKLEYKYAMAYQDYQKEQLRIKGLENVRGMFEVQVEQTLQGAKRTDGSYDTKKIDQEIRALWSDMQIVGKAYGLHRNEVSESLISFFGPTIYKTGNTRLWGFAFVKDEDGQKLTHTAIGEKVLQWMNRTDEHQKTLDAEARRIEKEQIEQYRDQIERAMAAAVVSRDPNEIVKATQLLVDSAGILQGESILKYQKAFENRLQEVGFAIITEKAVEYSLRAEAADGALTFERLDTHRPYLTVDVYDQILQKMIAVRKERNNKAAKSRDEIAWGDKRTNVKAVMNKGDVISNKLEQTRAPLRADFGMSLLEDYFQMWRNNELKSVPNPNKKSWPNQIERDYLGQLALYRAYKEYPDAFGTYAPQHPDTFKQGETATNEGNPFATLNVVSQGLQ